MNRGLTAVSLPGALIIAASVATPAFGDADGEQKAAAETLFEEGRTLVEKGVYEEACPKFAESERLEPGIGTMLWLADCLENDGQTASAWAAFKEAASTADVRRDPRAQVARARAGRSARSSRTLRLPYRRPLEIEGLEVLRDGVLVGRAHGPFPFPSSRPPYRCRTLSDIMIVDGVLRGHADASSLEIAVPILGARSSWGSTPKCSSSRSRFHS